MASNVTVRHNFETAHRLPHLPGKCVSLHGHSWWAEVTVTAPIADNDGMVVEFGSFKQKLRAWIDSNFDHGVILGPQDPLIPALRAEHCKVYELRVWPTVENVAAYLAVVSQALLEEIPHVAEARVTSVQVQETHVNRAGWSTP